MVSSVYWEWEVLLYAIKLGAKVAFIYDGVRICRLIFSHKKWLISIEDLIYWIYVTILIFQLQLEQSDGVLRGYSILGIVIGMTVYNKLLGEKIIALAEKWICFIKRRLTSVKKMLKIKLCKHTEVSKKSRRENGKKKNSGKEKKAKPFRHDIGVNGSDNSDAGSGCE